MSKEFIEKVAKIQATLNAPKSQYNNFGKYNYRSCEDILVAVKPLLCGLILTINDEIVNIGGRFYVRATAKITDGLEEIANSAFAREEETKKGMDGAQVTGASSSYARKYALNGLFCIDDNKDADATNTHDKETKKEAEKPKESKSGMHGEHSINQYFDHWKAKIMKADLETINSDKFAQDIQKVFAYLLKQKADKEAQELEKIYKDRAVYLEDEAAIKG